MGAVFSSYAGSTDVAQFASPAGEECKKHYDYIICGGGTAGCVIASRLTEDPDVTVLVIEAGESDAKQLYSRIPAGWPKLFKSPADWNFETTPQAGANGRNMYLPRGKMLGGCSAINAQIYQHCAPSDYDDWEKKGAEGWNWQAMKPYFRRAENFTPNPDYEVDLSERGKGGLWNTSYPPTNVTSQAMLEAGIAMGIPANVDYNLDRGASGISRFQATVDSGGTRSSTSAAYLPSTVFNRPNLAILTATTVTRLLLSNGVAEGVEVAQTRDGPRFTAKAKKEVIVCQGAYGTPQLLLLSGVGGKDELEKIGVKQEVELDGVGRGLRDHLMAGPTYRTIPGASGHYLQHPVYSIPAAVQWMSTGKGPLSSNGAEIGAFMRSDNVPGQESAVSADEVNASSANAPDLEIISTPCHYMNHSLGDLADPNGHYYTIFAVIIRPKSRGSISCSSSSAFDPPLIDQGYLTDSKGYDMKVLLEGVKFVRRMAKVPPLSNFLTGSDIPDNFDDMNDEQLMAYIRERCETIYHPMSSCRIGAKEDGGVVDSDLRVYGVKHLRICDASIFPDSLSGHPQAGVVACAEKCVDLLKGV